MDRIKALQARLPRELCGNLNLIYMNALAELHNHGTRLGCDYRTMTPPERTSFIRQVGRSALQNRHLIQAETCLGAAADVAGAGILPHMIALELIDWIETLLETVTQQPFPILLTQDRDSTQFSQLLLDVRSFYPQIMLRSETKHACPDYPPANPEES